MPDSLNSISTIDGRYSKEASILSNYFSESALMRYRVMVEVEYLISLSKEKKLDGLPLICLLYTSPSPRDRTRSRMPSSA